MLKEPVLTFRAVQKLVVVAVNHVLTRSVPVVHSVAQTIFEGFAPFANSGARPVTVAERLKTLVPNLIEIVGVDVALREAVAVDVGAGADAAASFLMEKSVSELADFFVFIHYFPISYNRIKNALLHA